MIKTTIRIPTVQFGFIEVECEAEDSDDVIRIYQMFLDKYKESQKGSGLEVDDF